MRAGLSVRTLPKWVVAASCLSTALVTFSVGEAVTAGQAGAAIGTCGPSGGPYLDSISGNTSDDGYWEGISANIIDLEGALCSSGSGDEYILEDAIIEVSGNANFAFADSGIYRTNGNKYVFIWDSKTSTGSDDQDTGATLSDYGDSNHFWVERTTNTSLCPTGGTPCIAPLINSDSPLNGVPISDITTGYSDLQALTTGALTYMASDQGGSSSSPTTIDQLQYQVSHSNPQGDTGNADSFISDMNDYGGLSYYNDSGTTSTTCIYEHRWGYTHIDYTTNEAAIYSQTTGDGSC